MYIVRSFVKINLLFRIMDPLKSKSPIHVMIKWSLPNIVQCAANAVLFNDMYAASMYLSGSHKPINYVIKTYNNYMIPTYHLPPD